MDSLIVWWCDIEYGSIDASKRRIFRNDLELCWNVGDFASLHKKVYRHDLMFETLKTFTSLRRGVYWDDLELCWHVRNFASLHKKVYRHDFMFETLKTFASLRREVY